MRLSWQLIDRANAWRLGYYALHGAALITPQTGASWGGIRF
jgi:hypothetical protein